MLAHSKACLALIPYSVLVSGSSSQKSPAAGGIEQDSTTTQVQALCRPLGLAGQEPRCSLGYWVREPGQCSRCLPHLSACSSQPHLPAAHLLETGTSPSHSTDCPAQPSPKAKLLQDIPKKLLLLLPSSSRCLRTVHDYTLSHCTLKHNRNI